MFKYSKIIVMLLLFTNLNDSENPSEITLFLCGDVMTGRGIDQVLPNPGNPVLYESFMKDAKGYVRIAERKNGRIPKSVTYSYIWGDALNEIKARNPDIKLINLETSITKNETYWKHKGINYRMHPDNIRAITSAKINCCSLANNHTLDWDYAGLTETLKTLKKSGTRYVGAGKDIDEAAAPAIYKFEDSRVLIFGVGMTNSGIPSSWKATQDKPGLNVFMDYSQQTIDAIKEQINKYKLPGDIIVLSLHWEGNWGYDISKSTKSFAHSLVDVCGVDVIHGHSSHHAKGLEVYNNKLILYGCGDFINDYEGITGYELYRDDLSLMYFIKLNAKSGNLISLEMVPTQIKRFKINIAEKKDRRWLLDMLNRECKIFGLTFKESVKNTLVLQL